MHGKFPIITNPEIIHKSFIFFKLLKKNKNGTEKQQIRWSISALYVSAINSFKYSKFKFLILFLENPFFITN